MEIFVIYKRKAKEANVISDFVPAAQNLRIFCLLTEKSGFMQKVNCTGFVCLIVFSADSDCGWENLLTNITISNYTDNTTTVETIDYDEIGNPISYRGATLGWYGRQLKSFAKNGVSSSFTYDADGLRSSKTVGTRKTEYQYVGDKLFYEKRGDNQTFYYFYDSFGNLSMIRYTLVGSDNSVSTATYLAQTNSQGDVVALYTKAGNLYARYEYDAWGNTLSVTDANGNEITAWYNIANANPIRYRGYYYDTDLGLYYLQSRYYDSEIGRFINADEFETVAATPDGITDKNLFAYCDNNPIVRADYGGAFWHIVAGAAIGGLFELGSQLLAGEEVNLQRVAFATITGGLSAALGPIGGAAVSGISNAILDVMGGERDVKKVLTSAAVGVTTSLIGYGAGKAVEKIGGKIATKVLGKMSRTKLKTTATSLIPKIKGTIRNKCKSISYLTENFKNIGKAYFESTQIGKILTNSIEPLTEGFTSIGVDYYRRRWFPSW